jgi:RHS repeat-associated protein
VVTSFNAEVNSAQDYFAFGAIQNYRNFNSGNYRYGFNGKENDNEVKQDYNGNNNIGAQQDYGERIYDPRLGRFLSVDPIASEVPGLTPYQFGGNSPIAYIDFDGLESAKPKGQKDPMSFFIDGVQDGLSEQSEDAQHALIKILSNPKIYHKLDEIADMAMRDPVKLVNDIDKIVSKSGRKIALDALKDAVNVGAAYVKDENKGAYEAGKFVSKYGVMLLAPEEEGVVSTEGIATGGDIKALAEAKPSTEVGATVGSSTTKNYAKTFFKTHPELEGQVLVHHAVEQQMVNIYPGLFTESEIHSIENLRGIPKELNNTLHLSDIRIEWNRFYKSNPNATREEVLKEATSIDTKYGSQFNPPVKQ